MPNTQPKITGGHVYVVPYTAFRRRGFMCGSWGEIPEPVFVTFADLVSVLRGEHGPGEFILKGA